MEDSFFRDRNGPRRGGFRFRRKTPEQTTAGQSLTRQAMQYIAANYTAKFSLDNIADTLHVNKSYLARTFKATTGTTLLSYHNYIRCMKAIEYLADSEYTITQVAGLVGFCSSAHFSKVFQKTTGMTPTACRNGGIEGSGR